MEILGGIPSMGRVPSNGIIRPRRLGTSRLRRGKMSRSPSTYVAPATAIPQTPGTGTVGTSLKYAREDHIHPAQSVTVGPQGPAGFGTVTPSTPTRTIGTAFQPSATNAVLCIYSIQIACTASLTGGQTGTVQLLSDASNPPTTVRATIGNQNTSTLTIGLTIVNNQTATLSYLVPIGQYVKLVSANVTGTPTFTMIAQTEEVLG